MARTASRWGLVSTVVRAVRTALRPGSPGFLERVHAVPRLVGATLRGEYSGTSKAHLALVVGALVYVVSPIDVLPEAVLSIVGLADDAVVVSWLAASLVNDTEAFIRWEGSRSAPRARRPRDAAADGPQDAPASTWRETVPSHVVR